MRGVLLAIALVALSGCFGKAIEQVTSTADRAVAVIDRGIEDIRTESASWQTVLGRVAQELPQDISEVIRTDAQNLASRSVAVAGVEFRCNVDFLANRAVASLQRLKAKLQGRAMPPMAPGFCQVVPDSIDLKASLDRQSKVTLHGYDLDNLDNKGERLKFVLVPASGDPIEIPEERIGRTTHYQVTLNLGEMARQLHTTRAVKIVSSWSGDTNGLPQVLVIPWEPSRRPERKNIERTTFMPPKIGRGDADFDTHDDEHMSVDVRGEFDIQADTIKCRVYMHAKEERSDWTEVGGWTEWATAYGAPRGWRIVDVRPRTNSTHTANITNIGLQVYQRPAGEVVSQFNVLGDRRGDEAGTWTQVEVHWRTVEVTLEQVAPEWAQ
jgi:hypothetical protein